MGYFGIPNSIAIEFDTWFNFVPADKAFDPNNNHIGLDVNGSVQSLLTADPGFEMWTESSSDFYVWVDYIGLTQTINVYISQTNVKPAQPRLSGIINLKNTLKEAETVRTYVIPLTGNTDTPLLEKSSGNQGLYIWGNQLERGDEPSQYLKTEDTQNKTLTRTGVDASNMLATSEDFQNQSIWKRTGINSVNPVAIANPIGFINATKISENTQNSHHVIYYDTIVPDRRDDYTISVFAKAAERDLLRLGYTNQQDTIAPAIFNLTNGTVVNEGSFDITNIESYGDGWYRCSATFRYATINPLNQPTSFITIGPINNNSGAAYAGTLNSGIYIWGAQATKQSKPGEYILTAGTPFSNAKHYDYINVESTEPAPFKPVSINQLYLSEFFNNLPWTTYNGASAIRYGQAPLIPAGQTLQPTFPEDDTGNIPSNVFKLIEGTTGSSDGYTLEQTFTLTEEEDISFDGSWTFSMYVREPLEVSPRDRVRIDLDGISCTGMRLGRTSVLFSVDPASPSVIVQPTTEGFVENVKATIEPVSAPSPLWEAIRWYRVTLTGTFGIPREQIVDIQGNVLTTFSGDDIVFFESVINNTIDKAPIRRIRARVAPASGNTLASVNYNGTGSKGIDIWGAQLEQGSVASPYAKSTTNKGYSFTAEITRTKPNERYYLPLVAWGRDFTTTFLLFDINNQNTRAYTGKDTLTLYNKKLGWNNPTPTYTLDISGSLFSTEANTLDSIVKSINNIPGFADLTFNYNDFVTINAAVSVNNNFITNSLTAINLYVTNLTTLSTRRDIIPLRDARDLPSGFAPNFYVNALTGLSAFNLKIEEQGIVRNNAIINTGISALNFTAIDTAIIKTNTSVSTITADGTIFGQVSIDPAEANPLEYNEDDELTLKRDSDIAFGIKPSDSYSTDDNSLTRSLSGDWDEDHDLPPGLQIQKPYFQNLFGVHDYISSRGLFGNNLTVYLFEDVVAGEARPNKNTSNLFQSGKYPGLHRTGLDTIDPNGPGGPLDDRYATVPVLCANAPGSWSRPNATDGHNNNFYGVQFYTTEWLGSNYPSLTAAGLRGGHYSWYKRDTTGQRLSAAATFGPRWVRWTSNIRFRTQSFCGLHNIGPRISNNPNYNFFTPIKPFDQPSPKFIIRNYLCYDPNLRFGDFGTGNPKPWVMVSRGEDYNIYGWSRPSLLGLSNSGQYYFKNLGFELDHNSVDTTPALWTQGSAYFSNILVSSKGRGRNVYGIIAREDGFASLPRSKTYWCGEYQLDPDFLKPSRWNSATKTFTTEWSGIRGATGPNYFPGFAVAAHGNYTPGTPEYNAFGYNRNLPGGVRRDGYLVGDYGGGAAGSFFSKPFENGTSNYIVDYNTEGREIGKNSQLQSSIILDGFFNLGGDSWDPSMFEITRTTSQTFAGNIFRTPTLSTTYRAMDWRKYDSALTVSPNDSHIELASQLLLTYRDDLGDHRNFSFFNLAGMANYWPYNNYLTPWSLYYINPETPQLQPTPVSQIYPHSIWRRNGNLGWNPRYTRFYKLSAEQRVVDITGIIAPDWIQLDPLLEYQPIWTDPLSTVPVYYNSIVNSPPLYNLLQDTPTSFRFTINNILSSFDQLKRYDEPGYFKLVSPFNRALTSTMVFYVTASR
jgi:hypothetical protein